MNAYEDYLNEIEERKKEGLHPKPIDGAELLGVLIEQIKDTDHPHREDSLKFFIYNVLPGTTSAAAGKANFLKEIILGESKVPEITPEFAFEQLSHMKGGPSIDVLLELALGDDAAIAKDAAKTLKTQVFLYEADMERLEKAFKGRQRDCQRYSRKLREGRVLYEPSRSPRRNQSRHLRGRRWRYLH